VYGLILHGPMDASPSLHLIFFEENDFFNYVKNCRILWKMH
jgi:hypothetical protein